MFIAKKAREVVLLLVLQMPHARAGQARREPRVLFASREATAAAEFTATGRDGSGCSNTLVRRRPYDSSYVTTHVNLCRDLDVGRLRQAALNARGKQLTIDGLVGAASLAAAERRGFARWRDVARSGIVL
jgi:hypothetical protein